MSPNDATEYQDPTVHKYHYPNVRHPLGDAAFRSSLQPRPDAYWMMIANGRALGFQRWEGSYWHARIKLRTGKYRRRSLGAYDANGRIGDRPLLSYDEALAAAHCWFASFGNDATTPLTHSERPVQLPVPKAGRTYTVGHALRDHLLWLQDAGKNITFTAGVMRRVLMPEFGDTPISKLKSEQILEWMNREAARIATESLAGVPLGQRQQEIRELIRRRRRTVNHDLCILRKALEHAFINRRVRSDAEWQRVRAFSNVHQPRPCELDDETLRLFFHHAPADIALLSKAGLMTGARLTELIATRCRDFIEPSGKLFFAHTKSGPPRSHLLSVEALALLSEATETRAPDEPLFIRKDGRPWTVASVRYELRCAQAAAGTSGVCFRAFRHTYGSRLANAGMPSRIIADQMGHKHVQTTEFYYAHLNKDLTDEIIRRMTPRFEI